MLAAPALAGFVVRYAGTRALATALVAAIGLYVQVVFTPIRHVNDVRAFDPAFIDRMATLDGNLVLVEISPHRDMDSDPIRRSAKTPFDAHFEGLLPGVAGQRFYSQMWDGWAWNSFRGEVVGAGTYAGRAIAETPVDQFAMEMRRWGVRHLLVWTDASRAYLATSGQFVERWRGGRWSHFEMSGADTRSVVTRSGRGRLSDLDFLGGAVNLEGVRAGDTVIVRTHYYPAWQARVGDRSVPLFSRDGQMAFTAPADGSSVVQLQYPKRRWLSLIAMAVFMLGAWTLARWPRPAARSASGAVWNAP
jgi:hypothetical protein